MQLCRICGNATDNTPYSVPEMMFGIEHRFAYFQCANCECLQIDEIPQNLCDYYPVNYYSYQSPPVTTDNPIKFFLKKHRAAVGLGRGNLAQRLLGRAYQPPDYYRWLKRTGLNLDSAVLDVGCGIGHLLLRMRKDGFTNLVGIDPFIAKSISYENGVIILKKELVDLDDQFDCIMLHHSFEHMSNPAEVLQEIHRLLKPNRYALIRIPVVSSYAWRHYREKWVNLDAPRHLFLHSIRSMQLLTKATSFQIAEVIFDSDEGQFLGSEQYLRGIPLRDPRSYVENRRTPLFTKKEIRSFKTKATNLNKNNDGDSACFYLYKK